MNAGFFCIAVFGYSRIFIKKSAAKNAKSAKSLIVIIQIRSDSCVIFIQAPTMIFFSTAEIGYTEMATDIYSRRGAESAEMTCYFYKDSAFYLSSFAPPAPLRENRMLNLQHRLILRLYEIDNSC